MVVASKLVAFARRFPDIVLDVTATQEGCTELVAAGFDAGIHLGESRSELAVVGSPDYFASHPKPSSPHDLPNHRCINLRGGPAGPYPGEFEKDGESLGVDVGWPLIVDDADLMIRAAIDGLGLTFSFEEYVAPQIASSALVRVLEDWCSPFAATFCTTQAAGSSGRRCPPLTIRFDCNHSDRTDEGIAPKIWHRLRGSSLLLKSVFCWRLSPLLQGALGRSNLIWAIRIGQYCDRLSTDSLAKAYAIIRFRTVCSAVPNWPETESP
jgi:hypothetical protein